MLLSKKTAFLSMCTVLCVLFLVLGSVIPTNTVFFTLFATVFVMTGVYEHKISGGIAVYIASSALGFFLVPDKSVWLIFTVFFVFYPIIKALIERIRNLVFEWILKIATGTAAFFVFCFLFKTLFFDIKISFGIVFIFSAIVFIVYDTALSVFLRFYIMRIKPHIAKK